MSDVKTDWTREELVAVCVAAVVPVDRWSNRDSASAQEQLGKCWALLSAGAEFDIETVGTCATDERTIWVQVTYPGFLAFEYGRSEREHWETDTFYLPTPTRLESTNGRDWYR